MRKKGLWQLTAVALAVALLLSACAPATPQVVEKEVVKTVVVEKPVTVEKQVVQTVVVEKVTTPTPQMAAQQIVRRLERAKKTAIAPNKEGGAGRDWVRVVWLAPLHLQADGSLVPALALSVDVSADGTEYTLHLDPKAVFSNGKPITAQAVKECWEWGAKAENEPSWGGSFLILKNVEGMDAVNKGESDDASGLIVVDDHTLKIKLTQRVIKFKEMLASYMLGVFDASDPVDDLNYWKKPAVSGPYQIEWDPDTGAVDLTPNPKWWRKPPIIQKVEFRIVADPQARLIAYDNNEVDILKDTGDLLTQIMTQYKEQAVRIPALGFFYLGVNSQLEPTDDVHLRRALLLAVDRRGIMKSLFPYHPVQDTMMPDVMP
jgi:ABC-type oligopeptide transport system substrate-binding subunit